MGTRYAGWQIQTGSLPTIQGVLERALFSLIGRQIRVTGAGRTDAGVHAHAQIAHFDYDSSGVIDFRRALNSKLPQDIRVISAEAVSGSFHARKSAIAKTYIYNFWQERGFIPSEIAPFFWQCGPLELEAVQTALEVFAGEHDFAAFQNVGTPVLNTVRKIKAIRLEELPQAEYYPPHQAGLRLLITGNGFLKQMVRNIAGSLVFAGQGKLSAADIEAAFQGRSRKALRSPTAPAAGLTLARVFY